MGSERRRVGRTNLSRGDDVLVLGVLVDGQTQDVISVLQVEALDPCWEERRSGEEGPEEVWWGGLMKVVRVVKRGGTEGWG